MTHFYKAFSAVLTCWGQVLLLEAFLKAEENKDLKFSSQKKTPVEGGSYDEPLVGVEQMVSSLGNNLCSSYLQVSSDRHMESSL